MSHSKTILVTGGAGFIGSNFIRLALRRQPAWSIVNLDELTYSGNPMNLADIGAASARRYLFVKGDIRDASHLERLFEQHGFDGIFHFAAESHVDRSIFGPEAFVDTNVKGTFCLLQAALYYWNKAGRAEDFRFLHVSTDEVYGSLGSTGYFTEETAYDPSSPYSASKAASDHFVNAYHRTYGLPTLITNCSNNYGPFQFPEKLIPLMILNILERKPLPVYGDGRNVRDWLYVEDHCEALLRIFEAGRAGETYNIGGNCEKTNIDIVKTICSIMDDILPSSPFTPYSSLITFVKDRPGHDRRYAIDSTKIREAFGWEPRHRFEEALAKTVDWYLGHADWVAAVRSGAYRSWIESNYGNRG